MVPARMRLHFYTGHGLRHQGGKFDSELFKAGPDARRGFKSDVRQTQLFKTAEQILESQIEGEVAKKSAWKSIESSLFDAGINKQVQGVRYTVGASENGTNKPWKVPIYNYWVSSDKKQPERDRGLWRNVEKGTVYSKDIDLMVVNPKANKKRFLKDAIKISTEVKGEPYEFFHFLACRDIYSVQPFFPTYVECHYALWVEPHLVDINWKNVMNFGFPIASGEKLYSEPLHASSASEVFWSATPMIRMIFKVYIDKKLLIEKSSSSGKMYKFKKSMQVDKRRVMSYQTEKFGKLTPGKINFLAGNF